MPKNFFSNINNSKDTTAPFTVPLGPSAGLEKDEIIIHAMPKRFLNSSDKGKKHSQNFGLLVLGGGIVLLVVLFVGFYFYISQQNAGSSSLLRDQSETSVETPPTAPTTAQPPTQATEENKKSSERTSTVTEAEENKQSEKLATGATTTAVGADTSSATGTKIIVAQEASTTSTTLRPAGDIDQDGLSDIEEVLLGTAPDSRDSDGDGFDDFSELRNLYNPAGSGHLIVNSNISKYSNGTYKYAIHHPSQWKLETIGGEESVLFRMDNNQFIQIIVQSNTKGQTINEWYQEQFDAIAVKDEQRLYKKGWTGVKSKDGLIAYLLHPKGSHIFTLTYNIGLQNVIEYKNIFEMMINGLEISD